MSEHHERGGDGLLVGILAVLVLLVFGGVGVGVFTIRAVRAERDRARMEAERAIYAEEMARAQMLKMQGTTDQADENQDGMGESR